MAPFRKHLFSCIYVIFLYQTLQTSHYCPHSETQVQRNWYSPSNLISLFYSRWSHLLLLTQIILLSIFSISMIRTTRSYLH